MHQWVHFSHWKSLGNLLCTWKEGARAPEGRPHLCAHHALSFFKHRSKIIDFFFFFVHLPLVSPPTDAFLCSLSLYRSPSVSLCCSDEFVKGSVFGSPLNSVSQQMSRASSLCQCLSQCVCVEACWRECMYCVYVHVPIGMFVHTCADMYTWGMLQLSSLSCEYSLLQPTSLPTMPSRLISATFPYSLMAWWVLPVPRSGCLNHHATVPVYQCKKSTPLAFWEHSQCWRLSASFPYRDKLCCGSGNHRWELSCRRIEQRRAMSGGIVQRFNSPLRRWQLNVYKCTMRRRMRGERQLLCGGSSRLSQS